MQETLVDVAAFVERFRDLSLEAFVAANPHPFLVGVIDGLREHELGYDTIDPTAEPKPGARPTRSVARGQCIFPVLARPETPFAHMVSVGRAANNDIVLAYEGISKLHAVFTRVADGAWKVSDSDSATGTELDGQRLPAGEKRAVVDGATVAFGPVRLTFMDAATLHTSLSGLAGA